MKITLEYESKINYAFQQNDIPFLRVIHLHNTSTEPLSNLSLRVWGEPGLAASWETQIAEIPPEASYNLNTVQLSLSPQYLLDLSERQKGLLHVEVRQEAELLASETYPYEVLAYNEWCGLSALPEILAAFILPNQPGIDDILLKAGRILKTLTGDSALNGYQSGNPERVSAMTAAIYSTIQSLELTYINPPASFEETGQKIRFPDGILHSRMGTCLDLSLLFAACLEQCGLQPLVILIRGHAFIGVWLHEITCPDAVLDDGITIRKRVDIGSLLVFETTAVTHSRPVSFTEACGIARTHLADESVFVYAVNVHSARIRRIRPLSLLPSTPSELTPIRSHPDLTTSILREEPNIATTEPMEEPKPITPPADEESTTPVSPVEDIPTRIARWKRKLLDLSLRNRLLNFKENKKSCRLLVPNLPKLENALAEGESFHLFSVEKIPYLNDPRDIQRHQLQTGENPVNNFLDDGLAKKCLYSDLPAGELERHLLEIYRESRVSLEEGGVNTLYLALGFLTWYEDNHSELPHQAPIILIPITINRPSIQTGYQITMADEEARINVTLLQKLEVDFQVRIEGLDPLPLDESGLDIPKIFQILKAAVLNINRWEITETAYIGHFSFTKFLLWYDLEYNTQRLLENPVIGHLVKHAKEPYNDGIAFPNPDRLDEEYPPETVYCATDADSSQLAAVLAAAHGKTFVLQGPPGTGKSQTITNIIAQCLAEGKRVLFVSAKMAALNVVHERLVKIGLGPYCLELHSNKTNKRKVLDQLDEARYVSPPPVVDDWEMDAQELNRFRSDLNRYAEMLRTPRTFGATPFQVISQLIGFQNTPHVSLHWNQPESITPNYRREVKQVVDQLVSAGKAVGELSTHAWRACRLEKKKASLDREALPLIDQLIETCKSFADVLQLCSSPLMLSERGWSALEIQTTVDFYRLILEQYRPTRELLQQSQWALIRQQIEDWIKIGRQRDSNRTMLFEEFKENILEMDLAAIHERLQLSLQSRFPLSWYHAWKAYRLLRRTARKRKLPKKNVLLTLIEKAQLVIHDETELKKADPDARSWLGTAWRAGEADWSAVEQTVVWTDQFRRVCETLPSEDMERRQKQKERWILLATDGNDQVGESSVFGKNIRRLLELYQQLSSQKTVLQTLLNLDEKMAWGDDNSAHYLERMRSTLESWRNHWNHLHEWCGYIQTRNRAIQYGLGELVHQAEMGELSPDIFHPVFEHSFYQWCKDRLLEEEPLLSRFQSFEQQRKIQRFVEKDQAILQQARIYTANQLSRNIPNPDFANDRSDVGILKREIKKQRAHMPPRKLFMKIPQVITKIKPCFLMSPLSVAQYINMDFPRFDLVIYDEASQLPVWDAVGAMARGNQAIVVGDSMQLPPTNFFEKMDSGDEPVKEEEIEDLESILDDCEASGFPNYRLKWHYRSRHEHLIAFSNYQYYKNQLITFPSAVDQVEELGVKLRYLPNGVYDKGGSRTNRREAEAIVQEIINHLSDPLRRNWSLGVVTLNQAQQCLIEDLLDQACLDHPEIEPYFSTEHPEPVIIKNLENVQGDERDVIILSITYGPDAGGKISMNFGPLNNVGGERRLNVAITRARRLVLVYSSLRPDQIDLSRTQALGVQHLRTYLDYAARGPQAIAEAFQLKGDADFDSPFEQDVAVALEKRGWMVHRQVGCSGYRIDLAVVHPEFPGRYLLGIECDGAAYHSAKVARDRDRLREQILFNLGWQLHRIWSSDWWRNREREIQKIEKVLSEAKSKPIGKAVNTSPPEIIQKSTPEPKIAGQPQTKTSEINERSAEKIRLPGEREYQNYPIETSIAGSEKFYQPVMDDAIQTQIIEITKIEGPIALERLCRLISALWGMSRVGNRIRGRICKLIPTQKIQEIQDRDKIFLWTKEQLEMESIGFRTPKPDDTDKRLLDEIPSLEIANAAYSLMQQQIHLPINDLMIEIARCFGYQRTTDNMKSIIQSGIELLIRKNLCRINEEEISLVN